MQDDKTKKDLGTGAFFALLSLVYFIGTLRIESYNPFGDGGLSSKTIPQLLAVIMLVLSLIILIPALIKVLKNNKADKAEEEKKPFTLPFKFLAVTVLLVLYIALFNKLGFLLSTFFYLSCMIYMLIPNKKKSSLIFTLAFSAGVAVLIYFLFNKCLGLILPNGILGF